MENMYIFIGIALIIIIAIIVTKYYSKEAKIKRKLINAEYKNLAKFKNNEIAKITGIVELIEAPLISPFSHRKCSYYHIHVEQEVSSSEHTEWETIIEEEVISKFLIKDDNRYAFINDENIESYVVLDKKYSSGFLNDTTDILEKYLTKNGIKSTGFLGLNKAIRYKEGILEIGEEIAVFGKGIWKDATTLNLPKKYGEILEITATKEMAVYFSDDPSTTLKTVRAKNSKKNNNRESHYQK